MDAIKLVLDEDESSRQDRERVNPEAPILRPGQIQQSLSLLLFAHAHDK